MRLLALVLLAVGFATVLCDYTPLPSPYSDYCILDDNENLYDPSDANKVKWYTVDLDGPPEEHFREIATDYKDQIGNTFLTN